MTCERFPTGYRGQSHEVVAKKEDGSPIRLGWQNGEDLTHWQKLAEAWHLSDLQARRIVQEDGQS